VLFHEPYGEPSNPRCVSTGNFDEEFEFWPRTLAILIEIVLQGGAVDFACVRSSSVPTVTWFLMVVFELITVIMLVNLLIALMAKSFDNMFELQEQHYLYLSSRQTSLWQQYPAVPPPLNLLSVPYTIVVTLARLPQYFFHARQAIAIATMGTEHCNEEWLTARARGASLPFEYCFPKSFAKLHSVDSLASIADTFIKHHSEETVREDHMKHDVFGALNRRFDEVESTLQPIADRLAAIEKQLSKDDDRLPRKGKRVSQVRSISHL